MYVSCSLTNRLHKKTNVSSSRSPAGPSAEDLSKPVQSDGQLQQALVSTGEVMIITIIIMVDTIINNFIITISIILILITLIIMVVIITINIFQGE